jgi:hypothetical protein
MRDAISIAGGWLGTYAYAGARSLQPPVRFEATFLMTELAGAFAGTIVDDSALGAADVTGTQYGLQVQFTKVYQGPPPPGSVTAPVEYEGRLSEDGRFLNGTWLLAVRTRRGGTVRLEGVWDAHRLWSEAAEREEEAAGAGGFVEAVAGVAGR